MSTFTRTIVSPDLPVGTPVHVYPHARDGRPLVTRTASHVIELPEGGHYVFVPELAAGIPLDRVDVAVSQVAAGASR